jgi:hypothetical protein
MLLGRTWGQFSEKESGITSWIVKFTRRDANVTCALVAFTGFLVKVTDPSRETHDRARETDELRRIGDRSGEG